MINFNSIYSHGVNGRTNPFVKNTDRSENREEPIVIEFSDNVTQPEKPEPAKLYGLDTPKTRSDSGREITPEFAEAINYYNDNMSLSQRHSVTVKAENNIMAALSKMEQDINYAYLDCEAFKDPNIMVVRTSPFRHYTYPRWQDKLLNFDIDELRKQTTADINSLNEIRDKFEYIMESVNGESEHHAPAKIEYDADKLAEKYLGMSYKDFAEKYPDELEKCKYVTYADIRNMNETMAFVYGRAKAYAGAMLDTTIFEAHNSHWDMQERKLYASLAASEAIYAISEFEYDGITSEGLADIESALSYNAFQTALTDKYKELKPNDTTPPDNNDDDKNNDNNNDGVNNNNNNNNNDETSVNSTTVTPPQAPIKRVINGTVLIFNPDGSVYNIYGQKIK